MKIFTLVGGLLILPMLMVGQVQVGVDIDGEAAGDFSGSAIALSSDGNVIVVGAPQNDDNGTVAGHVRVYERVGLDWQQRGSDIDGSSASDRFGSSVGISSNGNVIVTGATGARTNGVRTGHVQIYEWSGTSWNQRGNTLVGQELEDRFGAAVSVSDDGDIVAIGATSFSFLSTSAGYVQVFEWSGTNWQQRGSTINGQDINDTFGTSVAISSDGNTMAVGAPFASFNNSVHVRIYDWSGNDWTQRGGDINGEASADFSGSDVAISDDGDIVAIGADFNEGNGFQAGQVRVFAWEGGTWQQRGNDINGEAAGDESGTSVSLSADGSRVAIGGHRNDGNGSDAGHVRIFEESGGTWQQWGIDIDGEAAGDNSGRSVSLSADGNLVAVGAPLNDGNGTNSGHIRVYDLTVDLPVNFSFFRLYQISKSVHLTWSTATEQNNAHFTVQTSTDGQNWRDIGRVAGSGTTNTVQEYTFTHTDPAPGNNYYRLRQEDFGGAYDYSPVRQVWFDGEAVLAVFPNPATEFITVSAGFLYEVTDYTVTVHDATGRQVIRQRNQDRVEVAQLPSGVYSLVLSGGGRRYTTRFTRR